MKAPLTEQQRDLISDSIRNSLVFGCPILSRANEILQDANLPLITENQHQEFFAMIEKFDAEMSPPK
tara:strand:- start:319 stop:519 length:201 start_codon:yes stop_codon:yes gene_type:complete